jgi:multiple antibiotic resistance protein
MDQTSITAAGVIDTFLVLLIGVGPKLALVPFVEITASLDAATKRRVLRQMMVTAAAVALILMVLGELLRALLHFTVGSLSIAKALTAAAAIFSKLQAKPLLTETQRLLGQTNLGPP